MGLFSIRPKNGVRFQTDDEEAEQEELQKRRSSLARYESSRDSKLRVARDRRRSMSHLPHPRELRGSLAHWERPHARRQSNADSLSLRERYRRAVGQKGQAGGSAASRTTPRDTVTEASLVSAASSSQTPSDVGDSGGSTKPGSPGFGRSPNLARMRKSPLEARNAQTDFGRQNSSRARARHSALMSDARGGGDGSSASLRCVGPANESASAAQRNVSADVQVWRIFSECSVDDAASARAPSQDLFSSLVCIENHAGDEGVER